MLHIKNINHKRLGMLAIGGVLTSIGMSLATPTPSHAAECAHEGVSCIAVEFGTPVGDRTVNPSSNIYSATQFYLPVAINLNHAAGYTLDYTVKVYGSGSDLVSENGTEGSIPSVITNTSYNNLGKDGSQWGIRWNFGDKIEDTYADYRPVPSSSSDVSSVVVSDGKMDRDTHSITKQLTLGFAVAVDGNQASGSYANTITVAVVASPKDARTLFDITTMQEMTGEICAATTTPTNTTISTGADINATATGASYLTAIDTDGSHQGDGNFVPQKELVDTRDGKKYTIRKLADGNCWMVSNLEFDLVPTVSKNPSRGMNSTPTSAFSTTGEDKLTGSQIVLTNKDTDLNSIREWTPEISAELYSTAGTVWVTQRNAGQGTNTEDAASATTATTWASGGADGLRSFSSATAYPDALYSVMLTANPTFGIANTGEAWQRFGNLYNWTAATLGSGTKVTTDGDNATDSICPKGWKLPYNTGDDSFSNLLGTYGLPNANANNVPAKANQLANFPLNFMRTSNYYYSDGWVYYRTTHGYWWSATRSSSMTAHLLRTSTSYVHPQSNDDYSYGFAVRCVARQ